MDCLISANRLSFSTTTHNAASITNWCPHWQDSALIRLHIFKRNQVRHCKNSPGSSGTAWILPLARAVKSYESLCAFNSEGNETNLVQNSRDFGTEVFYR